MFIFSLVMSILPGPTNILSASYGKKNGLLNSIGFIVGAAVGFSILAITVGLGLIKGIENFPLLLDFVKYIGSIYMLLISVCLFFFDEKTALAGGVKGRFLDGFFIQWVNPKSWVSAVIGVSRFSDSFDSLAIFVLVELVVGCLCIAIWAYVGEQISKVLSSPKQQKILDGILGVSLATATLHILAS